jgi:putative ABC transport system permease protein
MLRNYLTVAIRNLLRKRLYSFINVTGLAVGMACCMLIALYVRHELSYDTFHSKAGRIYRVLRETRRDDGSTVIYPSVDGPLAPALMKDFPEVEDAVRLYAPIDLVAKYAGKTHQYPRGPVFAADPRFLRMFDFPMVKGDRATALDTPFSLVVSEEMARRYFSGEDPMGKVITFENRVYTGDFTVTGVIRTPENSSLKIDMVFSSRTPMPSTAYQRETWENWVPTSAFPPGCLTFIALREGIDAEVLESRLPEFMERYMGGEVRAKNTYRLHPFPRLHLYQEVDYPAERGSEVVPMFYGDIQTVYLFSAIACLILLIACVNYMNLSTARSASRAKEVGLRKMSGAFRLQIIQQFGYSAQFVDE